MQLGKTITVENVVDLEVSQEAPVAILSDVETKATREPAVTSAVA